METEEKLAAKIILDEPDSKDIIGWKDEASGNFSINSAYNIAIGISESTEAAKLNNIWKLRVPNCIRSFLWLVRHGRLMTNRYRQRVGLTANDKCWLCEHIIEDVEHVLRKYPATDSLWKEVFPTFHVRTEPLPFIKWFDEGVASCGKPNPKMRHNGDVDPFTNIAGYGGVIRSCSPLQADSYIT